MQFDLTIDGTPQLLKSSTLRIQETANRRCTASFRIDSQDRSYRPAEGDEVTIEEDSVLIFAGLVDRPSERGFAGPRRPGISTTVNVVDFTVYAERRFVNLTLAAGTLKSQLTTLVSTYLATYGVTLDAGQVDGPSMPELVYDYKRLDAVLNEMMTLTADAGQPFVWEIGYTKVFSAYQPSTDAAPFDLVGNDLPEVVGDIEVETSRSEQYANRIILKVPPKSFTNYVQTFTGDGSTTSFPLDITLTAMRYIVTNDGVDELLTFQGIGFDLAVQWLYYAVDNTIRRETTGVPDPPANGNVISITYDGTREATAVIAEDAGEIAAHGIWERVITIEDVPNETTAQALADAELAKRASAIQRVRYVTWEQGLTIGQQQTINVSARNVNGSAVIVDISTRDLVHRLERTVTAIVDSAQTNLDRSFQADYEIWFGDKHGAGGTSPSIGAGAPAAVGPAPPNESIQSNQSGAFSGDAAFLFKKAGRSVVLGELSSIDATTYSDCFIAGNDCHIANP
jgi:hypothetical protein